MIHLFVSTFCISVVWPKYLIGQLTLVDELNQSIAGTCEVLRFKYIYIFILDKSNLLIEININKFFFTYFILIKILFSVWIRGQAKNIFLCEWNKSL